MKSIDNYKDIVEVVNQVVSECECHLMTQDTLACFIKDIFPKLKNWRPTADVKQELLGDFPSDDILRKRLNYAFDELQAAAPFGFNNWLQVLDGGLDGYEILATLYSLCDEATKEKISSEISDSELINTRDLRGGFASMLINICKQHGSEALAQWIIGGNGSKTLTDERKDKILVTMSVEKKIGFNDIVSDEEWAKMEKYAPAKTLPNCNGLCLFLINENVIPDNVDADYLLKCILHAHFGKMYQYEKTKKIKFRNFVSYVGDNYFSETDYLKKACTDMGIDFNSLKKQYDRKFTKSLGEKI